MLSIAGAKPLTVALSSDRAGCAALAAAMLMCDEEELELQMIDDFMRELVNMTAGQIKRVLALDDALGLPKMTTEQDLMKAVDPPQVSNTPLSAGGVKLVLWIGPRNS